MSAQTRVTTASSIDGWRIGDYLGVVSVHLVAGTGLVSDFFAGLSDVFGGRSESYQRQLRGLYGDAERALLQMAESRGANWVIGFGADIDQISGKNTQMFMVTAVGTAVSAVRLAQPEDRVAPLHMLSTAHDVSVARETLKLATRLRAPGAEMLAEDWGFVTDNRIDELAPDIASFLLAPGRDFSPTTDGHYSRARHYFRTLDLGKAGEILYASLGSVSSRSQLLAAVQLICELQLVNYERVGMALSDGTSSLRRYALQTLRGDQALYSPADIERIATLIALIPRAFVPASVVDGKKGLFSLGPSWNCPGCSTSRPESATRCTSCGADRMGFEGGDLTPDEAVTLLQAQKQLLTRLLGQSG